ncbi:MAG: hypothetical protein JXR37_28690 [Kiritimatiellae bacterium]|nr:hypothetical protein [Kiritimatiellia bacterium]
MQARHSELSTRRGGATAGKPYRVLVVIGDQWGDPGSYLIHATRNHRPIQTPVSGKDFVDVVTMLRIWGVPFDVLRLDEQRLQINRFLNGIAEPNYGCVIWMADPDKLWGYSAHYETLRRVVEEYGMSLIALFDHIRTPAVAQLVGVDYERAPRRPSQGDATLALSGAHVITAGLSEVAVAANDGTGYRTVRCRPRPGTQVLGTLEGQPQLVVRDVSEATKAIWIGGGRDWFDRSPAMRALFRRALVHGMGYGVFNDSFENAFMFICDDIGASDKAYCPWWHYPTPSREAILKCMVDPLEKRGLVMVHYLCPGYANPRTRMIENPWTVPPFTDPFGNLQDYGSTKAGLDEGLRRGVFEIHAHRMWTHLNWDLDSPPGPWWDAPMDGERGNMSWYNENFDFRRGVSCPANDTLFTFKTGRDAIERQFGVTPLAANVRPGENLALADERLAVMAGYGVDRWHYLGPDRVIQFSIREMTPQQSGCHDIDLVEKTEGELTGSGRYELPVETACAARVVAGRAPWDLHDPDWPDRWRDKRWIGFNEYCAYLHTDLQATDGAGLTLDFGYDAHYCRHFEKNPSEWTLELSERYMKKLGKAATVSVDGAQVSAPSADRTVLTIPPGTGRHRVAIEPGG